MVWPVLLNIYRRSPWRVQMIWCNGCGLSQIFPEQEMLSIHLWNQSIQAVLNHFSHHPLQPHQTMHVPLTFLSWPLHTAVLEYEWEVAVETVHPWVFCWTEDRMKLYPGFNSRNITPCHYMLQACKCPRLFTSSDCMLGTSHHKPANPCSNKIW